MKIEDHIEHIKTCNESCFSRGEILDSIAGHNDNWILVLKALLIKKSDYTISKYYLLEKLNFMKDNPENPDNILDLQGTIIYTALKED